jgi:hypothetical protein
MRQTITNALSRTALQLKCLDSAITGTKGIGTCSRAASGALAGTPSKANSTLLLHSSSSSTIDKAQRRGSLLSSHPLSSHFRRALSGEAKTATAGAGEASSSSPSPRGVSFSTRTSGPLFNFGKTEQPLTVVESDTPFFLFSAFNAFFFSQNLQPRLNKKNETFFNSPSPMSPSP